MTQIEMDVARTTIRKNNAVIRDIETIDWEQRRYEIAKDAMYAMLSGKSYYPKEQDVAKLAVTYADALIYKLKDYESKE